MTQTLQTRPAIPVTVWMLGFVSLLMDVSSEMVNTLLPLYLTTGLGASALAVGMIEGAAVAVATLTKFLSGLLADLSQRAKLLAVLGYGLAAVSRLLFPLSVSVDQVVLAKSVDRVGKGIRGAPRDAMIAAAAPAEIRGASFGLRKSLDTVGGFAGPLLAIGAMMLFAGSFTQVFWLAAIPAALAMVVLIFFVRAPESAEPRKKKRFKLRDALLLTRPVWAVIGFAAVVMVARFSEAFVLLKALEAGFSATWVPLVIVILHAAYGLTAYPVGRLSDRMGSRGLLTISLAFLAAAHAVIAVASGTAMFVLGAVLWGLHMGFSQGLLASLIAAQTPEHLRGSAFGTFNLVTGLVLLIGNALAGWIWFSFGSAAPFWLGAALSVALVITLVFKRKSARKAHVSRPR
ncbi:MFS transporter [Thalassovita sp.]|uniref:MFS transporter n=1 Tax=Thalassovita sp. TaxID=1979401 RepID=UPI002AB0FD54|nr:MFS transporter [Thalassovita sp.]